MKEKVMVIIGLTPLPDQCPQSIQSIKMPMIFLKVLILTI